MKQGQPFAKRLRKKSVQQMPYQTVTTQSVGPYTFMTAYRTNGIQTWWYAMQMKDGCTVYEACRNTEEEATRETNAMLSSYLLT